MIRITTQHLVVGRGSRSVQGLAEGEYIRIEVSDTGCGIPREKRARIFDPFFSTKSRGRGLWLAVVQGIVKDLGGTVDLVSEPGRGTRFQIVLPCAEIATGAKALESAADQNRGPLSDTGRSSRQPQAAVVLVVEDESALRKPLSKMLSKQGFSVIEAGDGLAALDVIRKQRGTINFLCLDITLPGASSREVLEEARRLRPEMKVIVTSAYTEEMAGNLFAEQDRALLAKALWGSRSHAVV